MNKENRNSSQLWSVLARAVKCSYKEGKPKLSCNRHFEANHLTKKVFEIHSLEQPAEIDENTLWLELVPRPVIHQSNDSLELPTIVSSLHVRIYKTLGIAKTTDSCMNPLLDVLTGFDNTGNVHLWFSEILLAHSMFFDCLYPGLWNELYKNFDDHPIENVCELCAGMTGAAGLAISLRKYSNIFKTSYVLITDGNDQCVASISSIIEHNSKRLLDNCNLDQPFLLHMDVKNIRWPDDYLFLVVGGFALFASAVYIRFYKLTVTRPNKYLCPMSQCSPLIKNMSWGSITVETISEDGTINPNKLITYRDAKLWPNGSRAWDWNESGTGHFAGIQKQDVDELLSYKPNIIILSKGVLSQLKVSQSLIDYINQSNPHIKVMVETSKKAFKLYNEYAIQGERVAALIHTTC